MPELGLYYLHLRRYVYPGWQTPRRRMKGGVSGYRGSLVFALGCRVMRRDPAREHEVYVASFCSYRTTKNNNALTTKQHHCIYSSSIGDLPCVSNTDQWLNSQSTTEQLGINRRDRTCGVRSVTEHRNNPVLEELISRMLYRGTSQDLRKTSNRSVTEY